MVAVSVPAVADVLVRVSVVPLMVTEPSELLVLPLSELLPPVPSPFSME